MPFLNAALQYPESAMEAIRRPPSPTPEPGAPIAGTIVAANVPIPIVIVPAIVKKQPPPETPEALRLRTRVVASFWIVVILVGVPLWYITTSIYRAPLPLQEMQDWSEGKRCKAEFPLLVDVEAPALSDPINLLKTVQHALDDANDFALHRPHHLRLRLSSPSNDTTTSESKTTAGEDDNVACVLRLLPAEQSGGLNYTVHPSSRVIDIHYPTPGVSSSSSGLNSLAQFVADTLEEIFWQEQRLIEHLLLPHAGASSSSASVSTPGQTGDGGKQHRFAASFTSADIARRMSRVVRYAPTYHLTFSLFTAGATPASWDIESALTSYLFPLLSALSSISNFTISSQVQYYASLSPSIVPTWDDGLQAWTLKKEELSSFINSAEWPLASMSDDPTINFILYAPRREYTPLLIPSSAHGEKEGFLLPQWGGVMILNPTVVGNKTEAEKGLGMGMGIGVSMSEHLEREALRKPLETFATHLLALLGAPAHPASLPIRIDSLTRQRAAELLVSASATLGSLFRVASNLNSISIPRTVSDSVAETLQHLRYACEDLSKGRFKRALEMGRRAQEEAEKAFFERTMVAQVYFPEEHKVAVYLPLLGPVGVPLIMAVLREGSRWNKARKAARATRS